MERTHGLGCGTLAWFSRSWGLRHHQYEFCDECHDPQHLLGDGAFSPDLWWSCSYHLLCDRIRTMATTHREASLLKANGLLSVVAVVLGHSHPDGPMAHRWTLGTATPLCNFRLFRPSR